MKKEPLQKLEAEIRRRVPRLMELSFGCEFVYNNNIGKLLYVRPQEKKKRKTNWPPSAFEFIWNDTFMSFEVDEVERDDGCFYTLSWYGSTAFERYTFNIFEDFKIIGHTIDLEAVLEAMHKAPYSYNIRISTDGSWVSPYFIEARWQFGKSLENQSPELHEFLFELFSLNHNQ